jgi:hypothetical protein
MSAADINFFFQLREQLKLYHWQTHSYSRHKASDETLSALDEAIDTYVETYMGTGDYRFVVQPFGFYNKSVDEGMPLTNH